MSCRRDLYKRNIVYFKRYYRLLLWSVVVAVAVIVGSLTVGDSVRGTLRGLVEERLGQTETIIFAQESFLDERIMSDPLFSEANGYLLVEGFVAHEGRLLPVMVWGTTDESLESGQMLINEPLEKEMGGVPEGEVVLRLPAEGLVPSGSMFVTDTYTTSLRLGVQGVRSAEEGGNVNLRTEQVQPFNVFVSHAALAEAMGVEGRINIVMSERAITEEEWHAVWQKEDSGIEIGRREDGAEITSSRIFLQEQVVQSVMEDNPTANRLYSYLGNSIRSKSGELVYSFVTAMERYRGRELAADEAIVSDYTARRLGLNVGDAVSLSYFKMGDW
ncbi:MAG: ABC transporter permease, partial [Alistipes sp.]|nr:ABC transporter permease [Alistipes sp.]